MACDDWWCTLVTSANGRLFNGFIIQSFGNRANLHKTFLIKTSSNQIFFPSESENEHRSVESALRLTYLGLSDSWSFHFILQSCASVSTWEFKLDSRLISKTLLLVVSRSLNTGKALSIRDTEVVNIYTYQAATLPKWKRNKTITQLRNKPF